MLQDSCLAVDRAWQNQIQEDSALDNDTRAGVNGPRCIYYLVSSPVIIDLVFRAASADQ